MSLLTALPSQAPAAPPQPARNPKAGGDHAATNGAEGSDGPSFSRLLGSAGEPAAGERPGTSAAPADKADASEADEAGGAAEADEAKQPGRPDSGAGSDAAAMLASLAAMQWHGGPRDPAAAAAAQAGGGQTAGQTAGQTQDPRGDPADGLAGTAPGAAVAAGLGATATSDSSAGRRGRSGPDALRADAGAAAARGAAKANARAADSTAAEAAGGGSFAAALARLNSAEAARGDATPVAAAEPRGGDSGSTGLLPAPLLAAAQQPGVAVPAAAARIAAPVGTPAFATQLGVQISTFVHDGVQHARLELNPAELGPLTVQIQLDGQAARVNFAADHALTRQALEAALPTLAGSLREAGLTLSGGGVFEQPRQPPQGGAEGGGQAGSGQPRQRETGGGGGLRDAATAPVADLAARRRGVVDLVA